MSITNTVEHTSPSELPTFSGYRIMQRVRESQAWKYRGNDGFIADGPDERIQGPEAILQISQEEIAKAETQTPEVRTYELPPPQELRTKMRQSVSQFIASAVKNEWLPKEAIVLAGKINQPSDIDIADQSQVDAANWDFNRDPAEFPKNRHERPIIVITESIIQNRIEYLLKIANETNIALTDQQVITASLTSLGVHEWSHSLEKALQTQYWNIAKTLPNYDRDKDRFNTITLSSQVLYRQAKKISLPAIAGLKDSDEEDVHIERFATGFELEAIQFALEKEGLEPEAAKKFKAAIASNWDKRLQDFKLTHAHLNMEALELSIFSYDLRSFLKKNHLPPSYIPKLWDGLGYLAPYNRSQLSEMIRKALDQLNSEMVELELIAHRKD